MDIVDIKDALAVRIQAEACSLGAVLTPADVHPRRLGGTIVNLIASRTLDRVAGVLGLDRVQLHQPLLRTGVDGNSAAGSVGLYVVSALAVFGLSGP